MCVVGGCTQNCGCSGQLDVEGAEELGQRPRFSEKVTQVVKTEQTVRGIRGRDGTLPTETRSGGEEH